MSSLGRNDAFSVIGGAPAARFIEGHISRVTAGEAFVVSPTFDAGLEFGPCKFSGTAPPVGAECLVAVMTGTTIAWIVSWDGDTGERPGDLSVSFAATRAGCLLCDHASYLRAAYPDLFAALGGVSSPHGLPDGTHFNVPDFRGRGAIGVGTGTAAGATAHALGSYAGEEKHVLSVAELPSHTHVYLLPAVASQGFTGGNNINAGANSTTNTDGGTGTNAPHNNLGPSVTVNFFVKT